jgi:sulfatase maturation enzyme AslB (radical SAM superfamily)
MEHGPPQVHPALISAPVTAAPPTIALTRLRELWLHTGTACNLACPFCHEGSKPGDQRLQGFSLDEIAPLMEQAVAAGVERFAFTGGEPLILRDIHAILSHALQRRPVLVLTNGTAPFIRRAHQLASLRALPHALSFRVSIDYPDEDRHDAGRGLKNFRKALEGLRLLHAAGFAVGITRQQRPDEDVRAIENRFRNLLRKQRLPEDMQIVALPELGALGVHDSAAAESTGAGPFPATPACARSRMLIRRESTLCLVPCPLVDDDAAFDAPPDLAAALASPVSPTHPRCKLCRTVGVDYVGCE